MDTYSEMYEEAVKDEGPEGWGCIAWIAATFVFPALIGWGISELLAKAAWASRFATLTGVIVGLVLFVAAVIGSIWYTDKRGWLDSETEEAEEYDQ